MGREERRGPNERASIGGCQERRAGRKARRAEDALAADWQLVDLAKKNTRASRTGEAWRSSDERAAALGIERIGLYARARTSAPILARQGFTPHGPMHHWTRG